MGRLAVQLTRSVWALPVALVAGCVSPPSLAPRDPAQAAAHDVDLTATRAGYVDLMLGNIVRTTAHERAGEIFAIVAGYGGGYVTTAAMTGIGGAPSELLTFDAVMGATAVTDRMQGETYFGPSAIACFRYTIGYYGNVTHRGIPCPAGTSPAAAAAEAERQAAAARTARLLSGLIKDRQLPLDLAEVVQDGIGMPASAASSSSPQPSAVASAPQLGPNDFATANGVAALAVPQPAGACNYLRMTSAPAANGASRGVSVYAWAAPTRDPCTGQAALAEGGYVSADPHAGG